MNTIEISKKQLNKLLSMKDPAIVTHYHVSDGWVLKCNETMEHYIISSCRQEFSVYSWDQKFILLNPKTTVDLTIKGRKDCWYCTTIFKLCKLAGTIELDLTKNGE